MLSTKQTRLKKTFRKKERSHTKTVLFCICKKTVDVKRIRYNFY